MSLGGGGAVETAAPPGGNYETGASGSIDNGAGGSAGAGRSAGLVRAMVRSLRMQPGGYALGAIAVILIGAWFARPPVSWTFALVFLVGTVTAFLANGRYALQRIAGVVPVLLVVSFIVFFLMAQLPGDPAINILGPGATPDAVREVNEELGLDQPFFNRYGDWLGDAVMGDLGQSIQRREDVVDGISNAITPTLQLMIYSLVLAALISVPLGVYAAYRNGLRQDRVINTVMLGFFAVPPFVVAIVFVLFFAIGGLRVFGANLGFKLLPGARYVPLGDSVVEHFQHMIMPSLSLALGTSAVFMRLLRSDMIATLRLPFIDLARSKGLATSRILWRHALRPSMFTLLTVMGFTFGTLISGAVIIEIIFTLPGIGSYLLGAVISRDFIVVQGTTLVVATMYILVLVMVDFLYLALDPRLRTMGRGSGLGGGGG